MSKMIEIYNLNRDDEDVAYINIEQISSIKRMNYGNYYSILMNNNSVYETDRDSFEKIIKTISGGDSIRAATLSVNDFTKSIKAATVKIPDPLKKEVIGWRPIEEYDEANKMNPGRYDWVLVTQSMSRDLVPVVAEKSGNGKWYDQYYKELHFTPRYFFDMQRLSKEKED